MYTNGIPICVWPQVCAVHHSSCTTQSGGGHTGMGQVFTFAHDKVAKYCASQNATEQNAMLSLKKWLELK